MLEYAISFSEESHDDISAVQINIRLNLKKHSLIPAAELESAAIDAKAMHKANLLWNIEWAVYGPAQTIINELEQVVMATCKPEHAQGLKKLFNKLRDATTIKG